MTISSSQNFDYVFLGSGCASLSIVLRMLQSGNFQDKKILLIDKTAKTVNDRTWCFWEKENGFFEEIVCTSWPALNFYSNDFSTKLNISPYKYKMIRGIDFYNYCFAEIAKHNNITIIYDEIKNVSVQDSTTNISLNNSSFTVENAIVFNSIYKPNENNKKTIRLLQHFKGWLIETETPAFTTQEATLMDFRVHQQQGTTFAYILPLNEKKALIEYTLFSDQLLDQPQYNLELENYVRDFLKTGKYKIIEEEFGVIPMTNENFTFYKNGIYHIGTAGGQTKASSGYTFQFIQKQAQQIIHCLIQGKMLETISGTAKRFGFYDAILLRLLEQKKLGGDKIFSRLFQRNKASAVFKFLDNETSIIEELRIITTLPVAPFLKAAIQR